MPDQDWLQEVLPLFEAAKSLGVALSESIRNENIEDQIRIVQDILKKLPIIRNTIKDLPNPASAAAREAKKNLESALRDYEEGAKQGAKLYRDLAGGLGERLSWGGIPSRAAAGRVAFQKTVFEEFVKSAEKRLNEATNFFSKQ